MPRFDKGSLSPGHPLCGVTLQAVLQGTAQPSPHLWALQEIHGETLGCSCSSPAVWMCCRFLHDSCLGFTVASGPPIHINTSQCFSLLILCWLSFPVLVSFHHFMLISPSLSAVPSPSSCSFFHCVTSLLPLFLPTVHLLPVLLILFLFLITVYCWESSRSPGLVFIITEVQFHRPYLSNCPWHLHKLISQPMCKASTFLSHFSYCLLDCRWGYWLCQIQNIRSIMIALINTNGRGKWQLAKQKFLTDCREADI